MSWRATRTTSTRWGDGGRRGREDGGERQEEGAARALRPPPSNPPLPPPTSQVTRGEYTYANAATFNAEPRRRVDYQNVSFLAPDLQRVDPKDPSQAVYYGDYFLKTYKGRDFFNWYLYHDVFGQFNADHAYLVDAVKNRGLATRGISSATRIQRTVNRMAAAIKRGDPKALVTVGADSIIYNTDRAGLKLQDWKPAARNLYKDSALIAAGGDPLGTLDFYQVHSYPDWSDPTVNDFDRDKMVFHRNKDYWGLDKPLLAGEFWDAVAGGPQGRNPVTPGAWHGLLPAGYAGGLGWAWFDVQEQPGIALASPWRRVVKHAMASHWAALMPEVAAKLANPAYTMKRVDAWTGTPQVGIESVTEDGDGGGGASFSTNGLPTADAEAAGDRPAAAAAPAPGAAPGARTLNGNAELAADLEAGGDFDGAAEVRAAEAAAEAAAAAADTAAAQDDERVSIQTSLEAAGDEGVDAITAGGGDAERLEPDAAGPNGPLAGGGEHGPPLARQWAMMDP